MAQWLGNQIQTQEVEGAPVSVLEQGTLYFNPPSWYFLSHLLIAGCDIGVQISVRPFVRPFVRRSTFTSKFGFLDIRHQR